MVEILFQALETAGSGCLFPVSTTIIAAIIDAVPRVAMNELTLSFTTIKPFANPINAATKIVTKIANLAQGRLVPEKRVPEAGIEPARPLLAKGF